MFLKLDEIARELDEICLPLEQEGITGMRLLAQSDADVSTRALENAQEALGVKFPLALSRLVCKFDFGEFEVYAWLLGDEELYGRRVASDFERFFRALASIGIARLSKKGVPSAEEIAKFVQASDDKALEFWREMAWI